MFVQFMELIEKYQFIHKVNGDSKKHGHYQEKQIHLKVKRKRLNCLKCKKILDKNRFKLISYEKNKIVNLYKLRSHRKA